MSEVSQAGWKKCSACKKNINFESVYYVCNVSTCNRKRTALQFCGVSCWEVHLPVARHRESWAEERRSPSQAEAARQAAAEARGETPTRKPRRMIAAKPAPMARSATAAAGGVSAEATAPEEVLIVASRLKEYIRASAGYKTSERVLGPLSDIVREVAEEAIRNARADGRMTVLDRDIPKGFRR
jgi:hypothetical protein